MFALNMHGCAVWSLNNHAEALRFHDSCKPLRNNTLWRSIRGKEGSRSMYTRHTDGKVRFHYHDTDVVSWLPDDRLELNLSYTSRSTAEFARPFTPNHARIWREGYVLEYNGVYHPGGCKMILHPDGRVEYPGHRPLFHIQRTNAKLSRQLLAPTGYYAYRDWWKLMSPMLADDCNDHFARIKLRRRYTPWETLQMLAEPESWHGLMTSWGGSPDEVRKELQQYFKTQGHPVFYDETAETLPLSARPEKWRVM
jgi:hypothetical protein